MLDSQLKVYLDPESVDVQIDNEQKTSSSQQPKKAAPKTTTVKKKTTNGPAKKKASDSPTAKKKTTNGPAKKKASDSPTAKKKKASDGPVKKKTTDGPVKKKASDGPVKKKASDSPTVKKKKASDGPVKKKASDSPTAKKKKASDGPVKKKASDGPVKKKASDSPTAKKKKASDGPAKKKASGSPTAKKKKASDGPVKKKASDGPVKKKASDSPTAKKKKTTDGPAKKKVVKKKASQSAKDAQGSSPKDNLHNILKDKHAKVKKDSTEFQPFVFEEPDPELGSLFVEHPSPLADHILKVEMPTFKTVLHTDKSSESDIWKLVNPKLCRDFNLYEGMPTQPQGLTGDPVQYQFRNDDAVASVILLSFFLMAWVIAESWKFVRSQLRNFFITRERPNLFAERDDNVLSGRIFLVVQTCFLLSLLFFTSTKEHFPDVFQQVSPRLILVSATALSMVYYSLKIAIYNIVNHTFFTPAKCIMWSNIHFVSILLTGFALMPITLLVVFFDIPFADITLPCVLLLSVIKILLLYKCFRIFFSSLLGCVHLILYFCALEIIPLGIFAASLFGLGNFLLTS